MLGLKLFLVSKRGPGPLLLTQFITVYGHYLGQIWLLIGKDQRHSHGGNYVNPQSPITTINLKITYSEFHSHLPWASESNHHLIHYIHTKMGFLLHGCKAIVEPTFLWNVIIYLYFLSFINSEVGQILNIFEYICPEYMGVKAASYSVGDLINTSHVCLF